jgi:hypothetical protein
MPSDFTEFPPEPQAQAAAGRGTRPPEKPIGIDFEDDDVPNVPPQGLMRKPRHIGFWLGIALLLGALIALLLVGIVSD